MRAGEEGTSDGLDNGRAGTRNRPVKAFIVGGTGFIGYHAALACLAGGHRVDSVSLPDIELGDWFPAAAGVAYGDVFRMGEDKLTDLFRGADAMVYAVGPDERIVPTGSAYEFFHERLVVSCTRVIRCARMAGVRKAVICGSYFCHFDRRWPEKRIAERNPYVRCRVEQARAAIREGRGEMDVCILELPFIFGSMPERVPLWKEVIADRFFHLPVVFSAEGGNAMVSVRTVAQAIVGAIEHGEHGARYPIGDVNMTHRQMLVIMMEGYGIKRPIVTIPRPLLAIAGALIKRRQRAAGREGGLDLAFYLKCLFPEYLTYDAESLSKRTLGYQGGDVREAILETMAACRRAD